MQILGVTVTNWWGVGFVSLGIFMVILGPLFMPEERQEG